MAMPISDVRTLLAANQQRMKNESEGRPAVRLFTPLSQGGWLLSQIDVNDLDKAFGLCHNGDGHPVLAYVSLNHLFSRFGHMSVRCDASFQANQPLSAYAAKAISADRICS